MQFSDDRFVNLKVGIGETRHSAAVCGGRGEDTHLLSVAQVRKFEEAFRVSRPSGVDHIGVILVVAAQTARQWMRR